MLVVKKFNLDSILPEKRKYYRSNYSRSLAKNTQAFVDWERNLLAEFKRPVPKKHRLCALALRLNQKNLDDLSKHIGPMDYLNFSPKTDDSLKDDEIGIELNEILEKDK